MQGEAQIDGLLTHVTCLRQMREGTERLLKVHLGLAVGLTAPQPSPPADSTSGLVPHFAPQGMVCQALDLFGQAVRVEAFEKLDNAPMQHTPSLQKQTFVGHLLGEGVLEGVCGGWERPRLIEELGGLEVAEVRVEFCRSEVCHGLEERHSDIHPDDGSGLVAGASSGGRRSMRAASTASIVSGTARGAGCPPCSMTFQANSSKKKGIPRRLRHDLRTTVSGTDAF